GDWVIAGICIARPTGSTGSSIPSDTCSHARGCASIPRPSLSETARKLLRSRAARPGHLAWAGGVSSLAPGMDGVPRGVLRKATPYKHLRPEDAAPSPAQPGLPTGSPYEPPAFSERSGSDRAFLSQKR